MKRFIKYLPLVLLFISCVKQPEGPEGPMYEAYDTSSAWPPGDPNAFWDK